MSRIGKEPIIIPENVKVNIRKNKVVVTGSKGKLEYILNDGISAKIVDNAILVSRISDEKKYKSLHGLNRSLINNMVIGVSKGYLKKLMIVGTGYKAEIKGKWLVLSLGFSHDIYFEIPEGINISLEKIGRAEAGVLPGLQVIIDITGHNKELLGSVAAAIRNIKPPEPFKGKGIRYADEHVRKKAGKIAGGAAV
ncbi:MAG: 50S ribosomal protein L6 [Candidatus Cloacimonetes bacterium]|nr:50S ribosomal protein L6 [Candidatus Cloacimonadota bacterium]